MYVPVRYCVNLLTSSYNQLPSAESPDQMQVFSFCKVCGKASPFMPMSEGTKAFVVCCLLLVVCCPKE